MGHVPVELWCRLQALEPERAGYPTPTTLSNLTVKIYCTGTGTLEKTLFC